MTDGYKLREIKTVDDLGETGNIRWLELHEFKDLKGKYVIDDRQVTTYEPEGSKVVNVVLSVNKGAYNVIYDVEAEVDIVGNELYIAEEEIDRII